jgi:hypothetical protein
MALEWCKFVNGKRLSPNVPVYLRAYLDIYSCKGRVQDAVAGMKSNTELLEHLNKELVPEDLMEQD